MKTSATASTENVKVFVRCRPFLTSESSNPSSQYVNIDTSINEITLKGKDPITFDGVFDNNSSQEHVYEECAAELVENIIEGYNGTIFAYGQTGSGKTFTMMGDTSSETLKGIIPRSFEQILKQIGVNPEGHSFFIRASFLEIYNEEIHDLLKSTKDGKTAKCEMKQNAEKGFIVKDLSQEKVHTLQDLLKLLSAGNKRRVTGKTDMNKHSSRSHAMFSIIVESSIESKQGSRKITAGR